MSNMKQLEAFLEELKGEQMKNSAKVIAQYLKEGKISTAEQVFKGTLKNLDTLRDKISEFITTEDAPIMEPFYDSILFFYKDKKFMFSLDKAFNDRSNDILHLWHLASDNTVLAQVDWFCGSTELEELIDKYLKTGEQEINMIPIEYYIWDNFRQVLDNYINKLANN